ncbi:unnamed protein product [Cuscuta campestris]|uniref:Uncharacterized protein n=1 Tax=Cuscuta campestris TaxID=132261 RepID=A0A484MNT0_9ASTE|nr:unnamed protein product [Cuscuta campestris]
MIESEPDSTDHFVSSLATITITLLLLRLLTTITLLRLLLRVPRLCTPTTILFFLRRHNHIRTTFIHSGLLLLFRFLLLSTAATPATASERAAVHVRFFDPDAVLNYGGLDWMLRSTMLQLYFRI